MDLFYIRFKGRVTGPFQKEEIQKRAKEGMLSRFHDMSTDGQLWKKAAEFSDLWSIPSDVNSLLAPEKSDVPLPEPVITQTTPAPTITTPVTPDLWSIPSDVNSLLAPEKSDVPLPEPVITQTTPAPTITTPVTLDPFAGLQSNSTPTQSNIQWHYQGRNGDQCGPLPITVMQNLIRQGDIVRSTLIWANGFLDWTEAQYVPQLSSLF
jgi:hypothetical protein